VAQGLNATIFQEMVLLRRLELRGCMVTSDALGCQKALARTIVEREANYVLTLKANPGFL
jgi:predicted transposase YbfD/YdcC